MRGGTIVGWIGLGCDYARSMVGLTARRASWLIDWRDSVIERGRIPSREVAAVLGRLGFAAMALYWERPLLGPLYAWASAIATATPRR